MSSMISLEFVRSRAASLLPQRENIHRMSEKRHAQENAGGRGIEDETLTLKGNVAGKHFAWAFSPSVAICSRRHQLRADRNDAEMLWRLVIVSPYENGIATFEHQIEGKRPDNIAVVDCVWKQVPPRFCGQHRPVEIKLDTARARATKLSRQIQKRETAKDEESHREGGGKDKTVGQFVFFECLGTEDRSEQRSELRASEGPRNAEVRDS